MVQRRVHSLLMVYRYTKPMRRASTSCCSPIRQAFSLLELSIVLAILSFVVVSGLEVATRFIGSSALTQTQEKIAALDRVLDDFYQVNQRLPCPARRELMPLDGSMNYGLEDCTLTPLGPGTDGGMLAGTVPFRTLNIMQSQAMDPYGDQINYYVTRNMTNADETDMAATATGGIEVRGGNFTTSTVLAVDVAYVIFSSGADRRGAVNKFGVIAAPCADSNDARIDAQNCVDVGSNTGTTSPSFARNIIFDGKFNAGSVAANYFDDVIAWRSRGAL